MPQDFHTCMVTGSFIRKIIFIQIKVLYNCTHTILPMVLNIAD